MRPLDPPPPFAAATTVPEVIRAISGFAAWCETSSSRLGYFAALYLRITNAVEFALTQGTVFKNNELMAQLDVTFANRYLTALNGYFYPQQFPGISSCWLASFVGTEAAGETIVQYLLSGVAAHISLDLGVATQQVCGSSTALNQFQSDFDLINVVLSQQVQTVLNEVDAESPVFRDLYLLLGKHEIALIEDSLGGTRDVAWNLANLLVGKDPVQQTLMIKAQDLLVAGVIPMLFTPAEPLESISQLIAGQENQNVPQVIAELLTA